MGKEDMRVSRARLVSWLRRVQCTCAAEAIHIDVEGGSSVYRVSKDDES